MSHDKTNASDHPINGRPVFDTTRWSLVALAGREESPEASLALNDLCRAYWMPIYAEIRRRGHAQTDAQDHTQEFFACLLRRNSFGSAEKEKGRFRSYLLAALDHFLTDDWRQKKAEKRGGGAAALSLDADEGEGWFRELPARGATPAEAFDQGWAVILMDRALAALRSEYHEGGRGDVFNAAQPFLAADAESGDYDAVCEKLGMTAQAFTVAVHRLRKRFRLCVRAQVETTVADPADAAEEMRHLFGV